jgi:hypothetical protein
VIDADKGEDPPFDREHCRTGMRRYAAGGPVGAVIGGALGTATGAVGGAANMLAPPAPAGCPYGYRYYNGACYR